MRIEVAKILGVCRWCGERVSGRSIRHGVVFDGKRIHWLGHKSASAKQAEDDLRRAA